MIMIKANIIDSLGSFRTAIRHVVSTPGGRLTPRAHQYPLRAGNDVWQRTGQFSNTPLSTAKATLINICENYSDLKSCKSLLKKLKNGEVSDSAIYNQLYAIKHRFTISKPTALRSEAPSHHQINTLLKRAAKIDPNLESELRKTLIRPDKTTATADEFLTAKVIVKGLSK